jgi:integrase
MHDTQRPPCCSFVLGVAERAVMDLMGWSKIDMAQGYMHVPDELRQRIASQLGGLLWKAPEEDDDDGTAGALVPA